MEPVKLAVTPVDRLFSLEHFGIKLGLENILALLAALEHPERAWPSIHIAGTNGKGSVAAMVERALRAGGLRTGRYTSPHLYAIEERVALDGSPVSPALFSEVTADVLAVVDRCLASGMIGGTPTFFEVSTAIAFEVFRRAKVDVAVIEVGLGGRFDATNVLAPTVTAITSIAMDHERHLGYTLSDIAFEKAGIAKAGVPLIVGPVPPEAWTRITGVASDVGAPIVDAREVERHRIPAGLALAGRHQIDNATVAVAVLDQWSSAVAPITQTAVVTGLTECEWPARLEWLRLPSGADLLIDAAHNPAGAEALAAYLEETGVSPLPIVVAAMADKDIAGIMRPLCRVAASFLATTVEHQRAMPAEALAAAIRELSPGHRVEAEPSAAAAIAAATAGGQRAVAAGSIFLVGPLRARLVAAGALRHGIS